MTHTDDALVNASGVTAIGASTSSVVLWGLDASDVGVLVSALVAVLTLCVYAYYTLRKDFREQRLHERQMQGSIDVVPDKED